jgi:eukaryotic-like serine/threonine-protein kinase
MDESEKPRVQAENNSIAIGEITISGNVTGNISIGHTIIQAADVHLRHDLGILLKNVQSTWIKGVLDRSVHQAALLDLAMEIREEAVDNPWRMVIESPDQTRESLPWGKKIRDIFYEANGLILILGEPGSGKTTTLLQLARDLIAEVDQTFTQPVPVILNLSTWTNKEQPLNEWAVAELSNKYRVPKKDGRRWLEEHRILLLLDGLDEVRAENRAACVEKINQLVKEYSLPGLVVCSRLKDYSVLGVRLGFYRAIYIQPLMPEQVDLYLESAGDKLASLRATLQADEALKTMAQSPLILNIMSLAYQNTSAEDLSEAALNTNAARRRHLFDTYIARMFKRKAGARPYDDEQTKHWLSWLARNMQLHHQHMFLIEGLQPSWLKEQKWRTAYILASRSIAGLIIGLIAGLSTGLGVQLIQASPYLRSGGVATPQQTVLNLISDIINILPVVLVFGPLLGLVGGLTIGFIDLFRFKVRNQSTDVRTPRTFWRSALNILGVGLTLLLSVGLLGGLLSAFIVEVWLIGNTSFQLMELLFFAALAGSLTGPMAGLIGGLIFGLRGMRQSLENDIQTVESLRWSWNRARKGIPFGLIAGLGVTLIASWLAMFLGSPRPLLEGLILGLSVGLLGPLFTGLKSNIVEAKTIPNQGILLSRQNAILIGLIAGAIGVLFISLFFGVFEVQKFGWTIGVTIGSVSGLIVGPMGGLIVALWYGGLDIIQHYTLRLILVIQNYTPANYTRFLDYTVDRIFLQKVGGGYRFIHRLLLEHFAEMDNSTKKVRA